MQYYSKCGIAINLSHESYITHWWSKRQSCGALRVESFSQRKYYSATITSPSKLEDNVTSHTFFIEKAIMFNFSQNLLVGLKIILRAKIELIELYNIVVHYIYIQWWVHLKKSKLQIFPIHFSYIFSLTSPSTWVSDRGLQSLSWLF